jgi:hypothetical protein
MGDEAYLARRNALSELGAFEPLPSLRFRKQQYKADPEAFEGFQRRGPIAQTIHSLAQTAKKMRDLNPFLRGTIRNISQEYGSGISRLFYDWRWVLMMHFLIFIIWFFPVVMIWLEAPPCFENHDPQGRCISYWDRPDVGIGILFGDANGVHTTALQDSFMFYTGYTYQMLPNLKNKKYPMGEVWVLMIFITTLVIFAVITNRFLKALRSRKFDPVVQQKLLKRIKDSGESPVFGLTAQELVLASWDFSCIKETGQKGVITATITSLETLLATSFDEMAFAVQLRMGMDVFEIRCVSGHNGFPFQEYQDYTKGIGDTHPSASACLMHGKMIVYRRKMAAGLATEIATDQQLKVALAEYGKENPAAAKFAGASDPLAKAVECILTYGDLWKIPHAAKQISRTASGEWNPPATWVEMAEKHRQDMRPGVVFTAPIGAIANTSNIGLKVFGLFLTFLAFCVSATGVYAATHYQVWVETNFGPYGVSVILVIIQSCIPIVVKKIIAFEGWTDELKLQWTLFRVFVLKMANLVVLILQLNKLEQSGSMCASQLAGMYIYKLIVTGSVIAIFSNLATYAAMYYIVYKERFEFDNQTVAQLYIDLCYNTALVWIGYYLSPALPFAAFIFSLLELIAIDKCLNWFCRPANKPFSASASSRMMVMGMFMVTFAYSFIPLCGFLYNKPNVLHFQVAGSPHEELGWCGPIQATERRYNVLLKWALSWAPVMKPALKLAGNPIVLFIIVIILVVLTFFNWESTKLVRQECVDTNEDKFNSEAHLRHRRIQNNILAREKQSLEQKVLQLTQQVADLESGNATLKGNLVAANKKRGLFTKKDGGAPSTSGGCFKMGSTK